MFRKDFRDGTHGGGWVPDRWYMLCASERIAKYQRSGPMVHTAARAKSQSNGPKAEEGSPVRLIGG